MDSTAQFRSFVNAIQLDLSVWEAWELLKLCFFELLVTVDRRGFYNEFLRNQSVIEQQFALFVGTNRFCVRDLYSQFPVIIPFKLGLVLSSLFLLQRSLRSNSNRSSN